MSKIVVVDDDAAMCDVLDEALTEQGFEVHATTSPTDALAASLADDVDALVADVNMPGISGLRLCSDVLQRRPELPVILITAFGTMDAAVEALRAGAWDFITKPLDPDVVGRTLRRAAEVGALRREVRILRRAAATGGDQTILGASPAMRRLREIIARVARQDVTVLVQGETGTGKELVARELHAQSERADGPFIAVNCGAIPESLVESELFGHVRGAFTDARTARRGLLYEADGGTLFLDEIGELPASMQPRLLRALQERRARPVGSDREVAFDARVIAATNRDLLAEAEAGRFRADLYYRLAVITLDVPPLRERGNDLLQLAQRFLVLAATRHGTAVRRIGGEAAEHLLAWRWPGNVRELQNVMERAAALCESDTVLPADLPPVMQRASVSTELTADLPTLAEMEKRYIARVLDATGGNRAAAARILGVDRTTLWRKLDREDP